MKRSSRRWKEEADALEVAAQAYEEGKRRGKGNSEVLILWLFYKEQDVEEASGGLYHPSKKKRLYELGRKPANTLIADKSALRVLRTKGGGSKTVTLRAFEANVYNPKTKKHAVVIRMRLVILLT